MDQQTQQKISQLIEEKKFWAAQEILIAEKNRTSDPAVKEEIDREIRAIFYKIEEKCKLNKISADVQFGTSGWRGIIGDDFTFENVKRVTQAIVEMMQTREFLDEIGAKDFNEVRKKGGLLGFDSRFLGLSFANVVGWVLSGNGINIYYAGMATTPELSAAVVELGCAFSINLTPSHNPFQWAGLKFNPADGGPAGPNLTKIIEEKYKQIVAGKNMCYINFSFSWNAVDTIELYRIFMEKRNKLINLKDLVSRINSSDIYIVVDHIHGASRGRIERLLPGVNKIRYLRTESDYLFGGVKPEPSSANMKTVMEELGRSNSRLKIGVIMDPDGDRVRFTDGREEIEMNYFGAMALYYLIKVKGYKGLLAKSVATSNLANAVAEKLDIDVKETAVGFKEFRPYFKSRKRAVVAFEESDGISMIDHTLEKDAFIGFLLAIYMVLDLDKNLSDIRKEVSAFAGDYFPARGGAEVDRALTGAPLVKKLSVLKNYKAGKTIRVGHTEKNIKELLTVDGFKIIFDDNSWLLIRPSGTEPKVRFYVESRTAGGKEELFETAQRLLNECLK